MSKFCYESGEIQLVDCQCELCTYYNGGGGSEECPKELLEKIKKNELLCPKLKELPVCDFEL